MSTFFKILLYVCAICLVLGFFFVLTMMGPGKALPPDNTYIDMEMESLELLAQSEQYENEFEADAESGNINEETLGKLRMAIRMQEIYINKARILDKAPTDRLKNLQERLQNIEARPLAELVDDLDRRAKAASSAEDVDSAISFYREAYDIQHRINREFPFSKYKDIRKPIAYDREIRMMLAKPVYLESVAAEESARAALKNSDWTKAQEEFERTIKILSRLNSDFPSSGYDDFTRLQKLDIELASLKSSSLQTQIEGHLAVAEAAWEQGDTLKASDAYSQAAELQRQLNRLFPKSIHASEEKANAYEKKKNDAYSWNYGKEIMVQVESLDDALRSGEIAKVSDISNNLIRKMEQFRADFPKSDMIDSEVFLKVRYISFMIRDIKRLHGEIFANLKSIDETDDYMMLKTEVTQDLYKSIMQENPSRYPDMPNNPVDSVTLDDINRFCSRLSWLLARRVELPDADMLKRALGSTRYADLSEISWNNLNTDGRTQAVATKKPNDKGFYDLLGNVTEFVKTDGSFSATFGGSVQTSTDAMLELDLVKVDPKQRDRMTGFRVIVYKK